MKRNSYLPAFAVLLLAMIAVLMLPQSVEVGLHAAQTPQITTHDIAAPTQQGISGREQVAVLDGFDDIEDVAAVSSRDIFDKAVPAGARIEVEPQLPRMFPAPKATTAPSVHLSVTSSASSIRAARAQNRHLVRSIIKSIENEDYEHILSSYNYSCYPTYAADGEVNGYTVTSSVSLNQVPIQLF